MTTRERHLALSLLCIAAAEFRAWPPTTRSRQSGTPRGPSCRGRHRVPGSPRRGSFNFDDGERIARRSLTGKTDHRLHKVWFDCAELHWTRMLKTSRRGRLERCPPSRPSLRSLRWTFRSFVLYGWYLSTPSSVCRNDATTNSYKLLSICSLCATACLSPMLQLPGIPLNATQKSPCHTRAQIDHLNDSTPLTGSRSPRSSLRFSTVKWTVRAATTQRMKICAPMVAPRPGK